MRITGAVTLAVAGTAAWLLPSCSSVNCTTELRMALDVTVRTRAGTEICDAIVTATDGDFSAQLSPQGHTPPCAYFGPPERRGTYTVNARLDGQTATITGIRVTADQCHVHPRAVSLTLG